MKIAIKANPDRGKEIISLLKSLGGINNKGLRGNGEVYTYYIDKDNKIQYDSPPEDYKVYTLEEFEKEFPFKIGDKVRHISSTGIIKEYGFMNNKPVYVVKSTELGILATIPVELLKPYKEMEERNITLTLDKAKEWYKKGGELREIALQAFTERELNPLPRSWEEFCENCPIKEGESYIDDFSDTECFITGGINRNSVQDKNVCPSNKSAEAHLAMMQLEQLRDCWRQGWKPTPEKAVYAIKVCNGKLDVFHYFTREFLSFPTREMAEEFLECFRDLIEQAGDLI